MWCRIYTNVSTKAKMAQLRTANSMIIVDGENGNAFTPCRAPSCGKKKIIRREDSTRSLEFLPAEDISSENLPLRSAIPTSLQHPYSPSESNSRPNSRTSRAPPVRPDTGSTRRPCTPTRYVSLQAVKRKQQRDDDLAPIQLEANGFTEKKIEPTTPGKDLNSDVLRQISYSTMPNPAKTTQPDEGKANSGSQSTSDNEEEDEEPKAPNELLLEFIDCIYKDEWELAQKLCKMILIYEPDNTEANKFSPLIDEKLTIMAEISSDEGSNNSESDDSDSDDETDDDSDDENSSQDASDADSEPEDDDTDNDDIVIPKVSKSDKKIR